MISTGDATGPKGVSPDRVTADAISIGMPPLWVLWLFGYAYAFVIALVLQKLVMPIMPGLHAGHGLMNHDAIVFHDMAVAMADRIHASGWSEWRLLLDNGITANVSILAAIYVIFGADPVWFIPLNAGFHALGALLVLRLGMTLLPNMSGILAGAVAALLFLVFPSALVWYGQNHKDAFLIAGYLLLLFVFVRVLASQSLSEMLGNWVLMGAGIVLVAIMRPHMLLVYTVAFALILLAIALWKLIRPGRMGPTSVLNGTLLLGVLVAATALAPKAPEFLGGNTESGYASSIGWHWEKTGYLPDFFDRKLEQVSLVRAHFIGAGRLVGAGSIVDGDILPASAREMAAYLPRALWVGLFAPFPDSWLERPTLPRLIGAVETLFFYLMAPGILILVWRKPSLPLIVCLAASAMVLTVLSYTSPNVGTLHRIRYGPLFVFMLAGAGGWVWLLGKATHLLWSAQTVHIEHKGANPSTAGVSDSTIGTVVSGRRAVGAGALVTLVSMVGALGLLIRDLLLINRSDFGVSLDNFYLAMMVPMLFVSTLTIPLGDALTATLHRLKERHSVQSLLSATSGASLLVFGLLCLILFIVSGPIYRSFVDSGDIEQVVVLMPVALLLLLFSGLVVTGNSLLNSLDKPSQAAGAQLVVPLVAVAAILFAPEDRLIVMATAGMVAGQLLNLAILFVLVRHMGYHLFPGSIKRMSLEMAMLANYGWLVVSALLASLATPFNYWLAGQLGIGSVSTWAVGSKLVQMATALGVAMMSAVLVPYFSKLATAGLHLRIRNEVYLSLLASSWGGGLAALVIFGFAGPVVLAAMPAVQDPMRIAQLTGVIQLGALQLPLVVSGLMLLKLSVVSEVSWKVVVATLVGLLANVLLGYAWLPVWGIFGIAAAWCIATLLTTLVIMIATRAQSFLGWGELLSIVASWLVVGAFALAIHVKSLPVTAGAILIFALVFFAQAKTLISGRTVPEVITG